jgi:hypothetical protein
MEIGHFYQPEFVGVGGAQYDVCGFYVFVDDVPAVDVSDDARDLRGNNQKIPERQAYFREKIVKRRAAEILKDDGERVFMVADRKRVTMPSWASFLAMVKPERNWATFAATGIRLSVF